MDRKYMDVFVVVISVVIGYVIARVIVHLILRSTKLSKRQQLVGMIMQAYVQSGQDLEGARSAETLANKAGVIADAVLKQR
jgi:hypothetical protein